MRLTSLIGLISFIPSSLYPQATAESVLEIDYTQLRDKGIKALLFDVDNTLAPYDMADPPDEIINLLESLQRMGFKIGLISNNNNTRLERFGAELNAVIVSKAGKPGIKGIKKALHELEALPEQAVIIGDQIFTDVWCGNRAGVFSVLVKPVAKREEFYIKLKRALERIVLWFYFRKKKSNIAYNIKKDYNGNGFTLLECIITLAVSGIMACAVLLVIPASGTRALEEACRTLQADLRMAQRLSVIEGQRYRVEFDCVGNSYNVGRNTSSSSTFTIKERTFDRGVKLVYLSGNTDKVEYTPTGTTGDSCKITLENDNYFVNLTVNVGSGRILIKDYVKK